MLLVWPISIVWLGERPSPLALGGAAAVGAGLALASVNTRPSVGAKTRLRWSWITAAFIAAYHLAYGRALDAGISAPTAVAISIMIAVVVAHMALPRARRFHALAALKEQPGLVIVGGVLSAASFLIFLEGLRRSGAGAGLSLRNTSIAFTIGLSALMGERVRARQWFGGAMVAAGALFLGH